MFRDQGVFCLCVVNEMPVENDMANQEEIQGISHRKKTKIELNQHSNSKILRVPKRKTSLLHR